MHRPRIGFLNALDPLERRSWSGTLYHMYKALQEHCGDVISLGPIRSLDLALGRYASKAFWIVSGRRYLHAHSLRVSRRFAGIVGTRVKSLNLDVIFAPAASTEIASLETDVPIVYLSDATVQLMVDYYDDEFSRALRMSIRQAHEIERRAIQKSAATIFASSWAAKSAIEVYGANAETLHVIPFGANLDEVPTPCKRKRRQNDCELLFIGVDWKRKGADIAVEAANELRSRGVDAHLTIVGCTPPARLPGHCRVIPFLSKANHEQRLVLCELYSQADFFVLPTRAECFGIVMCEANAFGTPVIAPATGGVPDVIRTGENGFLLPISARGADYADVIQSCLADSVRYAELRASSRAAYDERLNWEKWGARVSEVVVRLAKHRTTSAM